MFKYSLSGSFLKVMTISRIVTKIEAIVFNLIYNTETHL